MWTVVDKQRRRRFKYVVLLQARRGPSQGRAGYVPTWVRGPYFNASEAHSAARAEREALAAKGFTVHNKNGDATVMVAELFQPEVEVDPSTLKEIAS